MLTLVTFVQKYKDKQYFCVNNISTENVFVTQLSINAPLLFTELCGLR